MKIILVFWLLWAGVAAAESESSIYKQERDLLEKGYRMGWVRISTKPADEAECMSRMHLYRKQAEDLRQKAVNLNQFLGLASIEMLTCVNCTTLATEACLRAAIDLIKYKNP